ncbi:heat stress transcription factor A-2d isoform X1 [Oryza glaberrima]|uniref:heat stress transcription factor A-2d isoform X1 n=1 Tax=Oryza glaberrima TaxID=4538 RepID=UPI00224BF746|nr:heat stress transcription factor A-2d isoform X1 [Oryza glaberrima]
MARAVAVSCRFRHPTCGRAGEPQPHSQASPSGSFRRSGRGHEPRGLEPSIPLLASTRLGGDDGEDDAGDGEGGVAAELAGGGEGAEAHGGAARGRAAAVPDQDVRPGGRPGHRRRRLVGPRGQQLRRLGPPRLRRRPPPTLLQAQQLLQLRPPAQHLPRWIKTADEATRICLFVLEDSFDHHQKKEKGFRKIDPDRWEFANDGFLRGQRHLLKMIKRRRPLSYLPGSQQALGTCLEVGQFGLDEEIDRLKRDKNILLAEVVKLRHKQQSTKANMRAMEERLQHAEQKQVQMMGFLARAMQNPDFFHQLIHQQDKMKGLEDTFSKKRTRSIDIVPFLNPGEVSQGDQLESTLLFDPRPFAELNDEPAKSELENLALNIQGLGKGKQDVNRTRNQPRNQASNETELTDDFWEELLNEGARDDAGIPGMERRRPRYVDALAQKLGYLSNSSQK